MTWEKHSPPSKTEYIVKSREKKGKTLVKLDFLKSVSENTSVLSFDLLFLVCVKHLLQCSYFGSGKENQISYLNDTSFHFCDFFAIF